MKKNIKRLRIILLILIFSLIVTHNFLYPHYTIDTMEMVNNGYKQYTQSKFFQDGRICSGILLYLIQGVDIDYAIIGLYIIGIIIMCLTVMYLYGAIKKLKSPKNKIEDVIIILISYITIFNFMYVDNLQFIEFPVIATSILLYIVGANNLYNRNKNYIIKAVICVLIATFCYQGNIGVFISYYLVLQVINNKNYNKADRRRNCFQALIVLCSAITLNLIFIAIYTKGNMTSRLSLNIIQSIKTIFLNLYSIIFESIGLFPKYIQIIFIFFILGIIYYSKVEKKKTILMKIIVIIFISIITSLIICLTVPYSTYRLYGRIFFTIGAMIGYIYIFLWSSNLINVKIQFSKLLLGVLIIYFVVQTISIISYCYYYRKGQLIDKRIMEEINIQIKDYEETSGITITKFAYIAKEPYMFIINHQDKNPICKKSSNLKMTINSAFFKLWLKKDIEQIVMEDEIYDMYFKYEENNLENNQKVIFDKDIMYLVTY